MKKILIFSLAYFPHASGAEIAIKEITDRISDIEFRMVTLRFGNEPRCERLGNVEVHRVGWGGAYLSKISFAPLAALKASALHRAHHFDAAWAMMSYMLLPITLLSFFRIRFPYVLTLQEGDSEMHTFSRFRILPFLSLINWGFRHASAVQVISTYLGEWARRRGFIGPIHVIPNGASKESGAEYALTELAALKERVGKKDGDVLLLSVGRLVPQKAIDVVIKSLALLPMHIKLLVAGDGPDEATLKMLADDLGVTGRVYFAGRVDRAMTAKFRKISDVFVLPSRSEGQGISFVSSMLARIPVVATREGGLADFIIDGETAWVVPKDSSGKVAEAVRDVLAHPEKAQRIAGAAYVLARERYDWDTIARDMRQKVFGKLWN